VWPVERWTVMVESFAAVAELTLPSIDRHVEVALGRRRRSFSSKRKPLVKSESAVMA